MTFADVSKPTTDTNRKSDFRKTEFMRIDAGAHLIRVLKVPAKKFFTHYINRSSVKCLEEECPICANNKRLIMEYPETFREQSAYNRRQERHYVNVLDKTNAKVCTSCGNEYKKLDAVVCSCGQMLPEAKPLDKVKMLAKGPLLFGHLETIHNSVLDESGIPIGINNYDINVIVSGAGRDISYTPIPNPTANAPVELEDGALFDREKAIITLTPEELLDLQRGITLKDIFSARRSKAQTVIAPIEIAVPQEQVTEVTEQIKDLFKQG